MPHITVKRRNLLRLDDNAIMGIWGKLEPIDRVQLAFTCKRFRKIFEVRDAPRYTSYRMENLWPMSVKDIESFAKLVGPLIHELRANTPCVNNLRAKKFLMGITRNCELLRRVVFQGVRVTFQLFQLFASAKYLVELYLQNCKLSDKDVEMISMLSNLIILDLSKNNEISGNGLHNLTNLRALYLSECKNLDPINLVHVFKRAKSLCILDIYQPYSNTNLVPIFPELGRYCLNLDKLRVTLPEHRRYESLARLPKLTKIFAYGCVRRFLVDLRNHRAHHMQVIFLNTQQQVAVDGTFMLTQFRELKKLACDGDFEFTPGCIDGFENLRKLTCLNLYKPDALTPKDVLTLLKKCPKLQFVQLFFKAYITEAFIFELIGVLEKRAVKVNFVLNLQKTNIRRGITKDPRYLAAKDTLNIVFNGQWVEWDR
ncbi:uncharacterized protein LOC129247853 [Anastrepha obliqua]|uniref:uncharacterized protein LOC129247853 n=1 Tax=Anastrepha obliqua TaxID=95512 RepID=UPI00240A0B3F|nr:uncharacterized protein LOC129247853 [Anastrepha obliqua]XP_054743181.1 uncharacterized protein LOC129247853 [Anastrepha obliqua]XP_054743182.1 uncharacterized protein LOC129247853 [Anastrepha obliqua]